MAFNNGPRLVTSGLAFLVDAADPNSYPGAGNVLTDTIGRVTGSLSGSVSYSSNYYGGLVFSSPTASITFPGTVANYGTSSFIVELAFRADSINGIHYLVSKNSGSFPNWGVYLSGSSGSGKLVSFFNISSSISCSVTSSTTFVTGSNYLVSTQLLPGISSSIIFRNGGINGTSLGNNGGSLTNTGSLFLGNTAVSSSVSFSGSLFLSRIYQSDSQLVSYYNYIPIKNRLQIPDKNPTLARVLVVGGGGGAYGTAESTGGGGGGGFIERIVPILSNATYNVFVGDGGFVQSGTSSYFDIALPLFTAIGGGGGGVDNSYGGLSGGSGGGGGSRGGSSVGQGTPGQGFAGGVGSPSFGSTGGGGGAGGTGSAYNVNGGAGGPGRASDISGVLTYYAGGGGGIFGLGGIGGGGNGNFGSGTGGAGTANTGGGGGGGGNGGTRGGKGGSGIVIIRYPGPQIATGGTITTVGGDIVHTFTATGSSSFTVF